MAREDSVGADVDLAVCPDCGSMVLLVKPVGGPLDGQVFRCHAPPGGVETLAVTALEHARKKGELPNVLLAWAAAMQAKP